MIIILMGVTGCGKSSAGKLLSKKIGLPFLDGDDYHPPENILKMKSGKPLNDHDRIPWLNNLIQQISKAGPNGCILACSALRQSYRDIFKNSLHEEVVFIYLKGSYDLISKRIAERMGHYMPADLLNSQFQDLEEPVDAITIDIDKSLNEITDEIIQQLKFET